MKTPPIPGNETERQRALDETCLLNSGAEARFDRITRLAKHAFSVPIALVSLVDRDRQWFKSSQGLATRETPRDISFCGHAILGNTPMIVEDAHKDVNFADNPLVTGAPKIRFYAGVPVHTVSGHRVGTLCLLDTQPRTLDAEQIEMLCDLAATVEEMIRADNVNQKSRAGLNASRSELASLVSNMPGVSYRCLPDKNRTMLYIGGQVNHISGYSAEELIGSATVSYAQLRHPDDVPGLNEAIANAMASDEAWQYEYRIRHRDGNWRWVQERGKEVSGSDQHPKLLEGFVVDITRERKAQAQLNKHHGALVLLNQIAFNTKNTLDAKIQHALSKARCYLGADIAILSQIESSTYTARWVDGTPKSDVHPGQRYSLGQTWCQLLFSGTGTELFVADAKNSEFQTHPGYQARPLGSYAGIVIEVEGRAFGTLNFCANDARPVDFDESDTLFIRLLASWLSDLLQNTMSSERLNKLMAQLPGVTYQFQRFPDGHSTFPFSSPQIQTFYGLTPAQAAKDASLAWNRIHPEDMNAVVTSVEQSAATLENWNARYRVRGQGGDYRWIEGQARPEPLSDGSILWHGYVHDIHDQEKTRQALERNESRLRSLFEFAPIGIALSDFKTGQFIDMNDALTHPSGYTREEFVHLNYWDLTPKEYRPEDDEALASLKKIGRYGPIEKEYIRKDGSRYPVRVQGILSQESNERSVIWSLVEDITERRKLDRMKSQFIATVSHELRTPLTSINGSLGLLAGGAAGNLPEKAEALLETAQRNVKRLTLLITDLLDMEKLVAGKMPMEMVDQALNPLIEEAVESMAGYASQHNVRLQIAVSLTAVHVHVDGARLIQALTNLISNAIKFSPEGEAVEISTDLDADRVVIRVCDHGPGVDPAFRSKLFQRFSHADGSDTRRLPGTGLGLAITREISRQLGGEVNYRDTPFGGGEFYIQLLRIPDQACR
ncbi:MAG: PAS domain-containing protein [Marinobacter sp.]